MVRLLSTIAVIAFAASTGTAVADCFGGHKEVTASVSQPQDGATMSTHDGQLPPLAEDKADEAKLAEAPETGGDKAGQDKK